LIAGSVFAQNTTPSATVAETTPSSVQAAQTSDLSLVGTLEGKRTWLNANGAQRTGGIKIEKVKIENGKGTGLLTGYPATGGAGPCSHVDAVPAQLTLDSSNVLTVVADSGKCGIWEYTLQRVSPTHFQGRHRINPTEIVLEFTPGS
jgi:hypothetical protein